MDTTTRVFKRQKINTDTTTGLDRYAEIIDIIMTGKDGGMITIKGRVALLAPNFQCMYIENEFEFKRYDRPEIRKDVWVVDSPAVIVNDEIITPEVGHWTSEVDVPANNKFTYLEESPVGQGIKQMLSMDLAGAIVDGTWVVTNLNMV